jgi:hypothetical protein
VRAVGDFSEMETMCAVPLGDRWVSFSGGSGEPLLRSPPGARSGRLREEKRRADWKTAGPYGEESGRVRGDGGEASPVRVH